jgi:hypothetical protein
MGQFVEFEPEIARLCLEQGQSFRGCELLLLHHNSLGDGDPAPLLQPVR